MQRLRLVSFLRRLVAERRAAAMPIVVAAIIPSLAMLGAGVDTARGYMAKSQLQTGVDAAALAGARAFQINDGSDLSRSQQVDSYFYGNFPKGYLDTSNLTLDTKYETIKTVNVTTVTAAADLPMMFMGLLGFGTQRLQATARAELQPRPLEVMLVLDNTGSLKTYLPADANGVVKTRITALKDAAKSFFSILYQGADTRPDLALGMITYDITVNVGALLTKWKSSSVDQVFAFNDIYSSYYLGKWPDNKIGWKGCVFDDATVKDINTTYDTIESGAWDMDRTLPGEGSHPAVKPYFIPPMYIPALKGSATTSNTPLGDGGSAKPGEQPNNDKGYYNVSQNNEPAYNLYKLPDDYASYILNPHLYPYYGIGLAQSPYRRWFYMMYIAMNDSSANVDKQVITKNDGSFYDGKNDKWDFVTNSGTPFRINYNRVPQDTSGKKNAAGVPYVWQDATDGVVNPKGGTTNDTWKNQTQVPNPNWQCPEPAVDVQYGRTRSFYNDQIDTKNAAIYPANGTLHHAGLLWGYRLLVRDDVFKRNNPTQEDPKRAIVFMTDGETALGTLNNGYTDRTWTFYGNYADNPISKNAADLTNQSERRFSKTCASLQAEKNPPLVYIIALTTTDKNTLAMFERCAPGRVYQTSDNATLKAAFDDVATELLDLHLTK